MRKQSSFRGFKKCNKENFRFPSNQMPNAVVGRFRGVFSSRRNEFPSIAIDNDVMAIAGKLEPPSRWVMKRDSENVLKFLPL